MTKVYKSTRVLLPATPSTVRDLGSLGTKALAIQVEEMSLKTNIAVDIKSGDKAISYLNSR